jgi:hypothetical protein
MPKSSTEIREIWAPVLERGFDRYSVSNRGRVRGPYDRAGNFIGKVLKPVMNSKGNAQVVL